MLREEKHFACECERCTDNARVGDLASLCHPRTGWYLNEDVMFERTTTSGWSTRFPPTA